MVQIMKLQCRMYIKIKETLDACSGGSRTKIQRVQKNQSAVGEIFFLLSFICLFSDII